MEYCTYQFSIATLTMCKLELEENSEDYIQTTWKGSYRSAG